jgi:hypothetical protein
MCYIVNIHLLLRKTMSTKSNTDEFYATEPTEEFSLLTLRLPPSTKEAFAKLCSERGTHMSQVVRRFIDAEIKNKPMQKEGAV